MQKNSDIHTQTQVKSDSNHERKVLKCRVITPITFNILEAIDDDNLFV